jgi:hypothetical protein
MHNTADESKVLAQAYAMAGAERAEAEAKEKVQLLLTEVLRLHFGGLGQHRRWWGHWRN